MHCGFHTFSTWFPTPWHQPRLPRSSAFQHCKLPPYQFLHSLYIHFCHTVPHHARVLLTGRRTPFSVRAAFFGWALALLNMATGGMGSETSGWLVRGSSFSQHSAIRLCAALRSWACLLNKHFFAGHGRRVCLAACLAAYATLPQTFSHRTPSHTLGGGTLLSHSTVYDTRARTPGAWRAVPTLRGNNSPDVTPGALYLARKQRHRARSRCA